MFTGLIQRVGTLSRIEQRNGGVSLIISHAAWDTPLAHGESVAVQGCCLTVTEARAGQCRCDCLRETLSRATLGNASPGAALNLERALRAADRLGGHLVAGHVDGIGRLQQVAARGRDRVLTIAPPAELAGEIVAKGSIACDGISLTVVDCSPRAFSVHVIPTTWDRTSLPSHRPGDGINLETDMIGKYVRAYLAGRDDKAHRDLSPDDLHRAGFV